MNSKASLDISYVDHQTELTSIAHTENYKGLFTQATQMIECK